MVWVSRWVQHPDHPGHERGHRMRRQRAPQRGQFLDHRGQLVRSGDRPCGQVASTWSLVMIPAAHAAARVGCSSTSAPARANRRAHGADHPRADSIAPSPTNGRLPTVRRPPSGAPTRTPTTATARPARPHPPSAGPRLSGPSGKLLTSQADGRPRCLPPPGRPPGRRHRPGSNHRRGHRRNSPPHRPPVAADRTPVLTLTWVADITKARGTCGHHSSPRDTTGRGLGPTAARPSHRAGRSSARRPQPDRSPRPRCRQPIAGRSAVSVASP